MVSTCMLPLLLFLWQQTLATTVDASIQSVRDQRFLRRSLAETTTRSTAECSATRGASDYPSELQLVYVYLVEFKSKSQSSLQKVADALSIAIANALDECDFFDRPLFQVKTTARHEFSKTGKR